MPFRPRGGPAPPGNPGGPPGSREAGRDLLKRYERLEVEGCSAAEHLDPEPTCRGGSSRPCLGRSDRPASPRVPPPRAPNRGVRGSARADRRTKSRRALSMVPSTSSRRRGGSPLEERLIEHNCRTFHMDSMHRPALRASPRGSDIRGAAPASHGSWAARQRLRPCTTPASCGSVPSAAVSHSPAVPSSRSAPWPRTRRASRRPAVRGKGLESAGWPPIAEEAESLGARCGPGALVVSTFTTRRSPRVPDRAERRRGVRRTNSSSSVLTSEHEPARAARTSSVGRGRRVRGLSTEASASASFVPDIGIRVVQQADESASGVSGHASR